MSVLPGLPLEPRRRRTFELLSALLRECAGQPLPASYSPLLDALFFAPPQAGFVAGASELSVVLAQGRAPRIRVLAEVLNVAPLSDAVATLGRSWGEAVLLSASEVTHALFDTAAFRALHASIYCRQRPEPAPNFRLGIGLELGGDSPIVKAYFDLHALPPPERRIALRTLKRDHDLEVDWSAFQQEGPEFDAESSRIVGMDFEAQSGLRAKLYWGARRLTWETIERIAAALSPEQAEVVARLRRDVCPFDDALASVLLSLSSCNGRRGLKLDVALARLYESDLDALHAVRRFVGPSNDIDTPFEIVRAHSGYERTRCLQQYLGVELAPDGQGRIILYYRPVGMETPHLNPELWPRACA